jgi:hypothetical protein
LNNSDQNHMTSSSNNRRPIPQLESLTNSDHSRMTSSSNNRRPRPSPRPNKNIAAADRANAGGIVLNSSHHGIVPNSSHHDTTTIDMAGHFQKSGHHSRGNATSTEDDASLGSFGSDDGEDKPRAVDENVDDSDSDWESDDGRLVEESDVYGSNLPPPTMATSERGADKFPNDTGWQKCLRYLRILPPVPNEGRTQRRMRYLIWSTLILDFLVAIVSIATFGGTVTMCCNQATMASIPGIDWNLFFNVISYIYLAGILMEIHPVVREGPIPWNLLNPIFGSTLGFAVFVDDSKAEAIIIWMMELGTVILECLTYLKLKKLYKREERRIHKLSATIKSERRKNKDGKRPGEFRKNAFLRERRNLRIEYSKSTKKLQIHFAGVMINIALICLTLLLMILVARGGGMCLVGGEGLDLFSPDQRDRCSLCAIESNGWQDPCVKCKDNGEPDQCFYPYF